MDLEVCSIGIAGSNLDLYLYITISAHFACDCLAGIQRL